MSQPNRQFDSLLQDYVHRNRKLERWAWLFSVVPLAIFIVLSLLAVSKAKEYARLSQESEQLNTTIQHQKAELEQLQQKSNVQQLAINIVKQQNPGARPKVIIYREAIAGQVDAALRELGYTVEQRVKQGNPALANKPVDTLSYGCGVSNQDIRTVATALTNAGFQIRRIVPAEKNKDPNLIQLVSSSISSDADPGLSLTDISVWSRTTSPCSNVSRAEGTVASH